MGNKIGVPFETPNKAVGINSPHPPNGFLPFRLSLRTSYNLIDTLMSRINIKIFVV
jgi:hypothetical protein